jgi:tetratricopeptide (TPR) repeat protein
MWDVFISHAWEDKETVARPLAHALSKAGISVWYDEFTLTLGDSLRRSIDRGLAESRYGLVILSQHFFAKGWPQRELDGLTTREIGSGKVILPVWHKLTRKDVEDFSPTLADKLSVSTTAGLDIVVQEILKVVRPEATPAPSEAPYQPQEDRPKFEPKPASSVLGTVQFPLRRFVSTIHNHPYVLAIIFLFIIIIIIGSILFIYGGQAPKPSIDTYYNRAVSNMRYNRCDQAIDDFSRVITGDPNNIDAYFNRGLSYKKTAQQDKAIDDFKEVLKLSNDTRLRQGSENILRDLGMK